MTLQERVMEAAKLRLRFQMNSRLRLESLAALSRVFREFGEPIREELLGAMVFAVPEELLGPADPQTHFSVENGALRAAPEDPDRAPATPGQPPRQMPATPGQPPRGMPATPGQPPRTPATPGNPPTWRTPATPGNPPSSVPATPGQPPRGPHDRGHKKKR